MSLASAGPPLPAALVGVVLVDLLVLALGEEGLDLAPDDVLVELLVVDDDGVAVGVLAQLLRAHVPGRGASQGQGEAQAQEGHVREDDRRRPQRADTRGEGETGGDQAQVSSFIDFHSRELCTAAMPDFRSCCYVPCHSPRTRKNPVVREKKPDIFLIEAFSLFGFT